MLQDPIIQFVLGIGIIALGYWVLYVFINVILKLFFAVTTAKWLAHTTVITYVLGFILAISIHQGTPQTQGHLPYLIVLAMVAVINFVTTPLLYWLDKRFSAKPEHSRIPENVLHTLAFLGGGFSAAIAQRVFRHKTQKKSFKIITPIAILFTIFIFYVLIKYRPILI